MKKNKPMLIFLHTYVAKAKSGEHSLVIPSEAKADINMAKKISDMPAVIYKLELMEISNYLKNRYC